MSATDIVIDGGLSTCDDGVKILLRQARVFASGCGYPGILRRDRADGQEIAQVRPHGFFGRGDQRFVEQDPVEYSLHSRV